MKQLGAFIAGLLLLVPPAEAQSPVTVIGPITVGNCAQFSSTTIIKDAGVVCGGGGGGGGIVIGTTTVTGAGAGQFLFNNSGVVGAAALGTMSTQNANAVAITGGTITGLPSPSLTADAATKGYVDAVAIGLTIHTQVSWATAAVLPNTPTYNNGSSGVGATLTAGGNAAIVVDGGNPVINDRVLVKNQAAGAQNGVYTVTTVGSGSVPWVLTRATDFNTATAGNMAEGAYFFVGEGTANLASSWVFITNGAITIGTTVLSFAQFSNSSGGQWTVSGSNIYYNLGNVGIGTTSPIGTLDVENGSNTAQICLNNVCTSALIGGLPTAIVADSFANAVTVSISSGAHILTSASAVFNAGFVGKTIAVPGAGTSGATLVTTVSAFTSSTQVTLTAAASTTLTSAGVNLRIFGTDNTSAFNTLITAMTAPAYKGACLYLPAGVYGVTFLNTITSFGFTGFCLTGDGPNETILLTNDSTHTILTLNGSYYNVSNIGFSFIGVDHSSGIYMAPSASRGRINNVMMDYANVGIDSLDNTGDYDQIYFEFNSATGKSSEEMIRIAGASGGLRMGRIFNAAFSANFPFAGVHVFVSGGSNPALTISDSDFLTLQHGLVMDNSSQCICGSFISNTHFDTGHGDQIYLAPTGSGVIDRMALVNVWTTSSTGSGIDINPSSGAQVSNISFTGGISSFNLGHGVVTQGSGIITGLGFTNNQFNSNSQDGVETTTGTWLTFTGNHADNNGSTGLSFNSPSSNFAVVGNVVHANGAADIFQGATGSVVTNNLCTGGAC